MSTYYDVNARHSQRAPWSLDGLGESQAYYDRIVADQNALTVKLAEVQAADQALWDQVWNALQMAGGKTPSGAWYYGWQFAHDQINAAFAGLMTEHNPSETDFAKAEQVIADLAQNVAYFKQIFPETVPAIQKQAADWKAKVENLPPLRSPAEVGMETFKKTLEERASALTSQFAIGAGVIAAGLAVAGILFLLVRR